LRFSESGNQTVVSLVPPLFNARRPTAIAGFVIAVVVDAVDGVLRRRTPSHVGEEIVKDKPALANRYAAPSI
jgi:hypothetical protein